MKTRHLKYTLLALAPLLAGCQVLTYSNPQGERFTRAVLGTKTMVSSLAIEAGTNGVRRFELRGYQNDATQALGIVTEAAVRAALHPTLPTPPLTPTASQP